MSILFVITGLLAGILSGLLGVGGGVVVVPILVLFFGFTQHMAQGTFLALMVPPIGILGAYVYYRAGHVDLKAAAFICLGFFLGGFLGARIAGALPDTFLKRLFGLFMLFVSIRMMLG